MLVEGKHVYTKVYIVLMLVLCSNGFDMRVVQLLVIWNCLIIVQHNLHKYEVLMDFEWFSLSLLIELLGFPFLSAC